VQNEQAATGTQRERPVEKAHVRRLQFTTRTLFTLAAVVAAVAGIARDTEMPWLFVGLVTVPFYLVLFLLAFLVLQPKRLAISYAAAHSAAILPLMIWSGLEVGWDRLVPAIAIACLCLPLLLPYLAIDWLWHQCGFSTEGVVIEWFIDWGVLGMAFVLGGLMYSALGYLIARFSLIGPQRTHHAIPTE